MKRIAGFFFVALTVVGFGERLGAQTLRTSAGKGGIFVYCGQEMPRAFSYVIERSGGKTAAGGDTAWAVVAELKAPKNLAAFRGDVLNGPASLAPYNNAGESEINFCWGKLHQSGRLDSIYSYAGNPVLAAAAGCGWWDDAPLPGSYQYRITRKGRADDRVGAGMPVGVRYPAVPGAFLPIRRDSLSRGDYDLHLLYTITDLRVLAGVSVYRSPLMRNQYTRIPVTIGFNKKGRDEILDITDRTAAPKVAYNYRVVPYDPYGNESMLADTLSVYNAARPKEVALFTKASALSSEGGRSIQLTWKADDASFLISVDVYRSSAYDTGYRRIANLRPGECTYTDPEVDPVKTYYYQLVANGFYGESWPSARMTVIQKAYMANDIPPQRLQASRSGHIVTLRWEGGEPDTRGYYVYRGTDYAGAMSRLSGVILSKGSSMSFTDTLPFGAGPGIYSYAVADENTSYAISPLSQRVTVTTAGDVLPVPNDLSVRYVGQHIELLWSNVYEQSPAIVACRVYRTATDGAGKEVETRRMLGETKVNSFSDADISEGWHYSYAVQALGQEGGDTSLLSNSGSFTVPLNLPLAPGHVVAMNSDNRVALSWERPVDPAIVKIRVYRSEVNGQPVLLGELGGDVRTYVDEKVSGHATYFYMMASVDGKGRESKLTGPVGIHTK